MKVPLYYYYSLLCSYQQNCRIGGMRAVVRFQTALFLVLLAVIPSGKHLLYHDSFVYQVTFHWRCRRNLFSHAVSDCVSKSIPSFFLCLLWNANVSTLYSHSSSRAYTICRVYVYALHTNTLTLQSLMFKNS